MPLPSDLCSNIVYLFSCPRCNARYVGSSTRWLKHRILEHMGKSIRTSLPLSRPSFSAIRQHSHTEDHPFTHKDFKILSTTSNRLDLLISESLHIQKMKPELNTNTAFQLLTVQPNHSNEHFTPCLLVCSHPHPQFVLYQNVFVRFFLFHFCHPFTLLFYELFLSCFLCYI